MSDRAESHTPDSEGFSSLPRLEGGGADGWELGSSIPEQSILSEADIEKICEPGAVAACKRLWRLNVQTVSSSANRKSDRLRGYHFIDVAADSLSDENREAILAAGIDIASSPGGKSRAQIRIAFNEDATDEMIEAHFLQRLDELGLTEQAPTWISAWTLSEMKAHMTIPDDEEVRPDEFETDGLFYDDRSGRFFRSEELRDKWRAWYGES